MNRSSMCRLAAASIVLLSMPFAVSAAEVEVIYTKKAGHPKAQVPGARDLAGDPVATEFRALEDLVVSYDGRHWILKSRNQLGSDLETQMILGSDVVGNMLAQEGQPIPTGASGELFEFFSSTVMQFNDAGQYGFAARARGGVSSVAQKVMYWDGVSLKIVAQQGDLYQGLDDPDGAGDELAGNSIGSIQVLNDLRFTAHDTTIQNIDFTRDPAIFYSDSLTRGSLVTFTAFKQRGVSAIGGSIWDTFNSSEFQNTPDGNNWLAVGEDQTASTTDEIMVVNDVVVIREGSAVDGGTGPIADDTFTPRMLHDGNWMARGDTTSGSDWLVRSGVLLAETGDEVPAGARGVERLGDAFSGFAGNARGDWVLTASTDNPDTGADQVMIYHHAFSGQTMVVAREGDQVDLDGNGVLDDDAYLGRATDTLSVFDPDDIWLTDDGLVYFIADLNDGMGNDLQSDPSFSTPDAFMRLQVNPCPADITDDGTTNLPDGVVNLFDLLLLLDNWNTDNAGASIALQRNVVNLFDLLDMIDAWGDCYPEKE